MSSVAGFVALAGLTSTDLILADLFVLFKPRTMATTASMTKAITIRIRRSDPITIPVAKRRQCLKIKGARMNLVSFSTVNLKLCMKLELTIERKNYCSTSAKDSFSYLYCY